MEISANSVLISATMEELIGGRVLGHDAIDQLSPGNTWHSLLIPGNTC